MAHTTSNDMIPKIIRQTYASSNLTGILADNVESIKYNNPGWKHELYDDSSIEAFILDKYDLDMLDAYHSINSAYGAARADLFRYLLMYEMGGVYLDIKSHTRYPLDMFIEQDDQFVISQWNRTETSGRAHWLGHPELAMVPGGEFQQWNIICRPRHPFLKAVIDLVLANIRSYSAWRTGIGQYATLRVTGPIAYTKAIFPILHTESYRMVSSEDRMGLQYSILEGSYHKKIFNSHYSKATGPLVVQKGIRRLDFETFSFARKIKNILYNNK